MGKRMTRLAIPKKSTAYAEHLRQQFPTTVGTPPVNTQNAWHNRTRQTPQFNYTVANFPLLQPTPITPQHGHTTPTHPAPFQLSASTPSTMTDAHTKSFIEECVQSEQAKLSESHQRIHQDLATLRTEFKQMIDDSKAEQDTRMQGFIKETIAANTKALTTSGTTPFATKGEMLSMFDNFKKEIREMLQPIPPANTVMQPRQPLQLQYPPYAAYPQYPGEYANRVC
jgi:hypothetical protein